MTAIFKNIALVIVTASGLVLFYFTHNVSAQTTAPETPVDSNTSRNWAGYVADGGTFTTVAGTWTVPSPSSSADGSDATWVGIGGVHGRDLLQTGTQAIVENGEIEYTAWYEALPGLERVIPIRVSAGDSVTASLAETSPGIWHIHLQNITTGETFDKDIAYESSHSSAEWIEEQPTGVGFSLALDQFGSVTFTGGSTTLNGATVSIAAAGGKPVHMANGNEEATASVSKIGADGASFTVSRTEADSNDVPYLNPYRRYRRSVGDVPNAYTGSPYYIYVVQDENGFHVYLMR